MITFKFSKILFLSFLALFIVSLSYGANYNNPDKNTPPSKIKSNQNSVNTLQNIKKQYYSIYNYLNNNLTSEGNLKQDLKVINTTQVRLQNLLNNIKNLNFKNPLDQEKLFYYRNSIRNLNSTLDFAKQTAIYRNQNSKKWTKSQINQFAQFEKSYLKAYSIQGSTFTAIKLNLTSSKKK
ncbi:MAG: hypothetical protein R3Y52_02975 [Psittacicella sp.]